MSNMIYSFAILFFIPAYLAANCVFLAAKNPLLGHLKHVRERASFDSASKVDTWRYSTTIPYDSRFKRICGSPIERVKLDEKPRESKFLGKGGFATVISTKLDNQRRAVKIVTLAPFLRAEIDRLVSPIQAMRIINGETYGRIDKLQFLSAPDLSLVGELGGVELLEDSLKAFVQLLAEKAGTIEQKVWLTENIPGMVAKFRTTVQNEIDVSAAVAEALKDTPSSAVKFQKCYVDAQLNTYVVMQQAGVDLLEAKNLCETALNGRGFEDQVPRYLLALLTLATLHGRNIWLCDIKLENTLLSGDFDPRKLFFADFGLAVQDRPCASGTYGYRPPEAYSAFYKDVKLTDTTRLGARLVDQFDAFSFGLTIAFSELNASEFKPFYAHFEKNFVQIIRQRKQKKNEAEANAKKVLPDQVPGQYKPEDNKELSQSVPEEQENAHNLAAELRKIDDESTAQLKSEAKTMRQTVQQMLAQAAQNPGFPNSAEGTLRLAVQTAINQIIVGLLDEEAETRTSVRAALYLFHVLNKLTNVDLTQIGRLEKVRELLSHFQVLLENPEYVSRAMRGEFEHLGLPAENLVNANELKTGNQGNPGSELPENHRASLAALAAESLLPNYETAVKELTTTLSKPVQHLLI